MIGFTGGEYSPGCYARQIIPLAQPPDTYRLNGSPGTAVLQLKVVTPSDHQLRPDPEVGQSDSRGPAHRPGKPGNYLKTGHFRVFGKKRFFDWTTWLL